MDKTQELTPVFVDFMPDRLDDGKLYISKKYGVAIHLCPCGNHHQVVTPIGNDKIGWDLKENDNGVSLTPSIYNLYHACKTHYFITNNKIVWC